MLNFQVSAKGISQHDGDLVEDPCHIGISYQPAWKPCHGGEKNMSLSQTTVFSRYSNILIAIHHMPSSARDNITNAYTGTQWQALNGA